MARRVPLGAWLIAVSITVSASAGRLAAADLSGSWMLEFQEQGSNDLTRGECAFKHDGDRLTGSCGSGQTTPVPITGAVKGRQVTFRFRTGLDAGFTTTFTGQLDDRELSLSGSWTFVDHDGNKGGGTFTAVKQ